MINAIKWIVGITLGIFILAYVANPSSGSANPDSDTAEQASLSDTEKAELAAIKAAVDSIAEVEYEAALKGLSSLRKSSDEFNEVDFYYHPTSPKYSNANGFYCYFGMSNDRPTSLRLIVQYHADDWLFINTAKFLIDGEKSVIPLNEFKRDNSGGKIWEYSDTPVNEVTLGVLYKIAESKETKMRLEGSQYYKDVVITSKQKTALRKMIDMYMALAKM